MVKKADQFDCTKCGHRNCDKDRRVPGSVGEAKFARWHSNAYGELRTCPLPMITADSREWLNRHKHYMNRILSHAGGIDDQPAAYKEAMDLINSHG